MRSRQRVIQALRNAGKASPRSIKGPIGRASRRFRSGFRGPLVTVVLAISDQDTTKIGPMLWDLRNQSYRNIEVRLQPWGRYDAVRAVAANPALRQRILDLRATHDQVIDEVSVDVLLDAHGVVDTERARSVVESWAAYLNEHRDEITALHVLYEQPQSGRVSFDQLRELAERIKRPPYNWTPDLIWSAYKERSATDSK